MECVYCKKNHSRIGTLEKKLSMYGIIYHNLCLECGKSQWLKYDGIDENDGTYLLYNVPKEKYEKFKDIPFIEDKKEHKDFADVIRQCNY